MKTTKLFFMAALALMTAACSNDDNELTPAEQPAKAKGITITAQLAPKTGGATTRAVADNGDNKITVTWAKNEHIAVLYTKDENKYVADATITAVDGSGTATISFTVEDGTPDDTPCTLVYPLSAAKDDHTGVKDAATLLAAQNGTLNNNLDVRVGAGKIQVTTPGLDVTTQPAAQFAIFKFTTQNASSTDISVTSLTASIDGQNYVITPASATNTLYAALPTVSGKKVSFMATGSPNNYRFVKDGVTFAAGKYYQSALAMTEATTFNLGSIAGNITAESGDVLTGTLAGNYKISIADGAIVTLDNVTINGTNNDSYKWAGITCLGDATIILKDGTTNSVKGFHENYPGIYVPSGKTLTIQGETAGTGKLIASSNGKGAGIGGGYIIDCGNIEIKGGDVTSTGYGGAAGIGSGYGGKCGNITIRGGVVTANGGSQGAGIGSGSYANSCGNIEISGGTVTATGGFSAAGIGTGYNSSGCGAITITKGITKVTATKGNYSGEIPTNCIGRGENGGTVGTITIDGMTDWTAGTATTNLNFVVSKTYYTNDTWTLTPKSTH